MQVCVTGPRAEQHSTCSMMWKLLCRGTGCNCAVGTGILNLAAPATAPNLAARHAQPNSRMEPMEIQCMTTSWWSGQHSVQAPEIILQVGQTLASTCRCQGHAAAPRLRLYQYRHHLLHPAGRRPLSLTLAVTTSPVQSVRPPTAPFAAHRECL